MSIEGFVDQLKQNNLIGLSFFIQISYHRCWPKRANYYKHANTYCHLVIWILHSASQHIFIICIIGDGIILFLYWGLFLSNYSLEFSFSVSNHLLKLFCSFATKWSNVYNLCHILFWSWVWSSLLSIGPMICLMGFSCIFSKTTSIHIQFL